MVSLAGAGIAGAARQAGLHRSVWVRLSAYLLAPGIKAPCPRFLVPAAVAPFPGPGPAVRLEQPALSVPCGFTGAGRPIGLHRADRPSEESWLLRIGVAFVAGARWCKKAAPAFVDRGVGGRR